RALVVDDVEANRRVIGDALLAAGCEVALAADAAEAVRAARAAPQTLAIVDVRMPGTGGVETARLLRGACEATRLVATSASVLPHEREAYLAAGFDGFLPKPVDLSTLYELLGRVPGVTWDDTATADDPTDRVLTDGSVSPALRERIVAAARRCSVTELRQCLAEAERVAPADDVVTALRRALKNYDMDAVVAAVDRQSLSST
ncbi:MAG TPA: response regulator, partial [Humisphaera sp.]